jgi:hypothetical protein
MSLENCHRSPGLLYCVGDGGTRALAYSTSMADAVVSDGMKMSKPRCEVTAVNTSWLERAERGGHRRWRRQGWERRPRSQLKLPQQSRRRRRHGALVAAEVEAWQVRGDVGRDVGIVTY